MNTVMFIRPFGNWLCFVKFLYFGFLYSCFAFPANGRLIGFDWLCSLGLTSPLLSHNPFCYTHLHSFWPPANWVCSFKSARFGFRVSCLGFPANGRLIGFVLSTLCPETQRHRGTKLHFDIGYSLFDIPQLFASFLPFYFTLVFAYPLSAAR